MSIFSQEGTDVCVYPGARILAPERIVLGSHVIIDDFVFIGAHQALTLGNYVHVATMASITGGGSCMISDFVAVCSGARVLTGSDDFSGAGLAGSAIPVDLRRVHRGRTWLQRFSALGVNVVVMPDVVVGEGSFICAASTVVRDTEPWTVYAGSPARAVKTRPRENILAAERLLYARHGTPLTDFSRPVFFDGRDIGYRT